MEAFPGTSYESNVYDAVVGWYRGSSQWDDPGDEAKGDEFKGRNGLFFGLEGVFGLNNDGITIEAADILSG